MLGMQIASFYALNVQVAGNLLSFVFALPLSSHGEAHAEQSELQVKHRSLRCSGVRPSLSFWVFPPAPLLAARALSISLWLPRVMPPAARIEIR